MKRCGWFPWKNFTRSVRNLRIKNILPPRSSVTPGYSLTQHLERPRMIFGKLVWWPAVLKCLFYLVDEFRCILIETFSTRVCLIGMCKVYNTIGSLSKIKTHLRQNGIDDFNSVNQLISFQKNYATARQQVVLNQKTLLTAERDSLSTWVQRL